MNQPGRIQFGQGGLGQQLGQWQNYLNEMGWNAPPRLNRAMQNPRQFDRQYYQRLNQRLGTMGQHANAMTPNYGTWNGQRQPGNPLGYGGSGAIGMNHGPDPFHGASYSAPVGGNPGNPSFGTTTSFGGKTTINAVAGERARIKPVM